MPVTPTVFCAVSAVIAVIPCTPQRAKAFRSAWIPAPPPESEPAIESTAGTGRGIDLRLGARRHPLPLEPLGRSASRQVRDLVVGDPDHALAALPPAGLGAERPRAACVRRYAAPSASTIRRRSGQRKSGMTVSSPMPQAGRSRRDGRGRLTAIRSRHQVLEDAARSGAGGSFVGAIRPRVWACLRARVRVLWGASMRSRSAGAVRLACRRLGMSRWTTTSLREGARLRAC